MSAQAAFLGTLAIAFIGTSTISTVNVPHAPSVQHTDSCTYVLRSAKVTRKNREHYRPFLDTTIVRGPECGRHVLLLPSRGTVTSYRIVDTLTADTVLKRTFHYTDQGFAWDITNIAGFYRVHMGACHMGGDFNLMIR